MEKISIRKGKTSKSGLVEFIKMSREHSQIELQTIVELGAYVGDSTEIFSKFFKKVISIDTWTDWIDEKTGKNYFKYPMVEIEKQYDERIQSLDNVVKIKADSHETSDRYEDQSLDMVYIDADHSYEAVKKDILMWYLKVKIGGIISGHDFDDKKFSGCTKAIKELLGEPEFRSSETSWGFVKISEDI